MRLSIIIVNWNVRELLRACLASIEKHLAGFSYEIFVVDNASTDGSADMVAKNFPSVRLIANTKNAGFAKANNQGIALAKGEYILLLNPDTECVDDSLKRMTEFLDTRPDIGILGPKLLNADRTLQPSVRRFPTPLSQALILLKLHHFFPNLPPLKKYFAKDFDYEKAKEADQVMGAAFLIRRAMIEKIGPLDEKYHIWFEEVDFCKRAKNAGWKVFYDPRFSIVHRGGASFAQRLSTDKQKIFNASMRRYIKKYRGFFPWLLLISLHPASIFLARVSELHRKKSL